MFDRLARLTVRWPRTILLVAAVLIGTALFYGRDVADHLLSGGQVDPGSESALAATALDSSFSSGRPNLVLLVQARDGARIDAAAVADEGRRLAEQLQAEPEVEGVTSYWQTPVSALRSKDDRMALIVGRVHGAETEAGDHLSELAPRYRGTHGPVEVKIGGSTAIREQVNDTIRGDIARAEAIGIPLTAVVLILVFRGFFAALLPLLVGIVSVIGTNASLKLISAFSDVSIFALNLATGLSLGLAADYGLFVVRRYREELRRGASTEEAVRITLNTAGRTVAFSSLTVAVAVSSMLVFPLYFLRSFAFAGVSVVLLASVTALVALPAGLVVLGRHVNSFDLLGPFSWVFRRLRGRRQVAAAPSDPGRRWRRMAELVMRHALLLSTGAVVLLLFLGTPFLRVNFGLPDDRLLPKGYESNVVQQAMRDDFDGRATGELDILVNDVHPRALAGVLGDYASRVSLLDHVVRVSSVAGVYERGLQVLPPNSDTARLATDDATYLSVESSAEDVSPDSRRLVNEVRETPAPFTAHVAGSAADLQDALSSLTTKLQWALAMIVVTTLVLIFLLTGSVLIPVKAVVMNTLSLSATFGVLVWIFQDYHLSGIFDFQQSDFIDVTLLVLLFCVAFGVSMDYEVFLLSRIKEEFTRSRDNRTAVVYGIEKTGGVVTAAALITSIVFTAMASSRVTNIKMFGVGLALAMIMDAALVRTVLVPAVMRLAGNANWWAPRPLQWVYAKFGLVESSESVRASEPHGPVVSRVPAGVGSSSAES